MKAAVIHGPGKVTCDNVDDPKINDQRDIILKVTATAICGSDLHIYSGVFLNRGLWFWDMSLWVLWKKPVIM